MRETRLGCVASSALKPQKKRTAPPPARPSAGGAARAGHQPPGRHLHQQHQCDGRQQRGAQAPAPLHQRTAAMARKDSTTAGRYTCQCALLARPACTSIAGTATMAICTVCSTNTPSSGAAGRHGATDRPGGHAVHRRGVRARGTTHSTMATPASASAQVAEQPRQPDSRRQYGAATNAMANISPMLPPTSAMALVRTASRVWSASSAVTAADTAPAPCSARPTSRPVSESASAASRRLRQTPAGPAQSRACGQNGQTPCPAATAAPPASGHKCP